MEERWFVVSTRVVPSEPLSLPLPMGLVTVVGVRGLLEEPPLFSEEPTEEFRDLLAGHFIPENVDEGIEDGGEEEARGGEELTPVPVPIVGV
jgi:hypothetical protein